MSTVDQAIAPPRSFCVVCDAEVGQCGHNTHRYLEDIVYLPAKGGGWIVPESERARWDAAPLTVAPKPKVNQEARDIDAVVRDISDIVYLDPPLEANLRTTHALDPLGVSRLAAATIAGAATGKLTSPGGFLMKRLAEIQRSKTKAT